MAGQRTNPGIDTRRSSSAATRVLVVVGGLSVAVQGGCPDPLCGGGVATAAEAASWLRGLLPRLVVGAVRQKRRRVVRRLFCVRLLVVIILACRQFVVRCTFRYVMKVPRL